MPDIKMAQLVRVKNDGIEIDLQPLGYYLATDPIEVTRVDGGFSKVRFSLIAGHVIIDPPALNDDPKFEVVVNQVTD